MEILLKNNEPPKQTDKICTLKTDVSRNLTHLHKNSYTENIRNFMEHKMRSSASEINMNM